VVALARGKYQGFNNHHLTKKLQEHEQIELIRFQFPMTFEDEIVAKVIRIGDCANSLGLELSGILQSPAMERETAGEQSPPGLNSDNFAAALFRVAQVPPALAASRYP
jgi:hypothetical protein